jgi:hypothetical protein
LPFCSNGIIVTACSLQFQQALIRFPWIKTRYAVTSGLTTTAATSTISRETPSIETPETAEARVQKRLKRLSVAIRETLKRLRSTSVGQRWLVRVNDTGTRCSLYSTRMGWLCPFSEFQNFTSSKPTFRIYVSSWLPTPVRKSRYQTQCNFLSNFETRDFRWVLRNASSDGQRGRLIVGSSPLFSTEGRKHCFRPLFKNSRDGPNYKGGVLTLRFCCSRCADRYSIWSREELACARHGARLTKD